MGAETPIKSPCKCYSVHRYCKPNPVTGRPSGDYLNIGGTDFGEHRDIVQAEYDRASKEFPHNPAFHMRPMFFTGSTYGREIWELARSVRPGLPEAPPACKFCAE